MTTLPLQLSEKPVVTLPATLAHQAGLEEGPVKIVLGEHSLTLLPVAASSDYTIRWRAMAATLHDQAAQLDLTLDDHRDTSYWDIVGPLYQEAERTVSSIG